MNSIQLLHVANLFFAGILAGMEIAIHYGVQPATRAISDPSQFQLRRALVHRLRVLVPSIFAPAALTGIAVAILDGAAPGLWLRLAGLLFVAVWIAIRVVGTVPINSATLTWNAAAPPGDWKAQVNHAERFHILGVWAAVMAFATFLAAAVLTIGK